MPASNTDTDPKYANLSAFLRENVETVENHFYPASPRIKGEDGKPIMWEICCISADEYAKVRKASTYQQQVPGKKGRYTQQIDSHSFQARICARCTVYPNLNSAQLQSNWGVTTPEALLCAMLTGGEFEDYSTEVFNINGFLDDEDLVEEAKN